MQQFTLPMVSSAQPFMLRGFDNRTQMIEDTGRQVGYTYDELYRLLGEDITDSVRASYPLRA